MELFSLQYFLFISILLAAYFLLPRISRAAGRFQWVLLLAASLGFYLFSGREAILLMLTTAFTVWGGGLLLSGRDAAYQKQKKTGFSSSAERKAAKKKNASEKRIILACVLLLNFGILAWLKYFTALIPAFSGLLLPLGISFYTFQAISYLIDQYNGKYPAERNFLHFFLFVSWFPQLLQGPIGRYDKLRPQFFRENHWDGDRTKRALLLILFGLMKKYAIADMLVGSISSVLDGDISRLPGSLVVFAILLYSAQQYADFSGGIDIISGVSLLFGIELAPNFRQPYFSTSLGDFWRRWHISLGAWMRDYLFYPFALLKPMQNFGKWCTKHMGKNGRHFGRVLPAGIANLVVFFVVGIWHGPQLHYVLWGLYNGMVIALSDLTEPFWKNLAARLRMNTGSRGFHAFRIVRTFVIVNIGWYFDRIIHLRSCLQAFAVTLTDFRLTALKDGIVSEIIGHSTLFNIAGGYAVAFLGLILVFADSLQKERGCDVCGQIIHGRFVRKMLIVILMMLLVITSFLFTESAGGFLYANF